VVRSSAASDVYKRQELATVDFGPPPKEYRETVAKYLLITLKDPFSVRELEISHPYKMFYTSVSGQSYTGWMVYFSYYAKNGYGAYNGEKVEHIMFRDGKVVHVGL
jgi:hypothetical protein